MSLVQPVCKACSTPCECAHVAWYASTARDLFGVAWRCPSCAALSLVVSPVGPDDIGPSTCVHCGAEGRPGGGACAQCGTSIGDVLTPAQLASSDEALIELARDAFALGTCRAGLTIVGHVLQRNPSCAEAGVIRQQFIEHLDAQAPFS